MHGWREHSAGHYSVWPSAAVGESPAEGGVEHNPDFTRAPIGVTLLCMDFTPNTPTEREKTPQKAESATVRWLLRAAGILAVIIGVVALLVPILPTTPFLLLAAACFIRSSDRFYEWLINHRWLGPPVKNYRERGGATLRIKAASIATLWCSVVFSSVFVVRTWTARSILAAVVLGVTVHLLTLKTIPRADASGARDTGADSA